MIDIFADVMIERGVPAYIRSDNGPEMVAKKLRQWLGNVGAKTLAWVTVDRHCFRISHAQSN